MKWWTEQMDGPMYHTEPGTLYAEDFGVDGNKPAAPPEPPPPPPPQSPPPLTQADVDLACCLAVQAAESARSQTTEDHRTAALTALAAGLGEARRDAAVQVEAVADGIARTALAMVAGALPHLCRAHGDGEVRAIVGRIAPLMAPHLQMVVRVHQGLIDTLTADIAAVDDTLLPQIEFRAANLPPGDVRLTWEGGRLIRDTAAIQAALHEGLAAVGLTIPSPATIQNGILEYAQ